MELLILVITALMAFLLHQFLWKKESADEGHVLGTVSSNVDQVAAAAAEDSRESHQDDEHFDPTSSETAPSKEIAESPASSDKTDDSQKQTAWSDPVDKLAATDIDEGTSSPFILASSFGKQLSNDASNNHQAKTQETESHGSTTDQLLKAIAANSSSNNNYIQLGGQSSQESPSEAQVTADYGSTTDQLLKAIAANNSNSLLSSTTGISLVSKSNCGHSSQESEAEVTADYGSTTDQLLRAIAANNSNSPPSCTNDTILVNKGNCGQPSQESESQVTTDYGSTTDQLLRAIAATNSNSIPNNTSQLVNKSDSSELDFTELDKETQKKFDRATVTLHTTAKHPGLQAYYRWKSSITSLYRVYAVPLFNIENPHVIQEAVLPMSPSSERGNTALYIEVTNEMSHNVAVYWVDYRGNELYKGSISPGGTWNQTTYIGHPWVFRKEGTRSGMMWGNEEPILLKYVPFRVVPSVEGAETVYYEGSRGLPMGSQRFTLKEVAVGEGIVRDDGKWKPACVVEDLILPEPPLVSLDENKHESPEEAQYKLMVDIDTEVDWCSKQMLREDVTSPGCGLINLKRMRTYLGNVSFYPHLPQYRKLRIGNPIFNESIYNTAALGVFLALGFEEHYGYLECGAARGLQMTDFRLRMISRSMGSFWKLKDDMESQNDDTITKAGYYYQQPIGADGFGRAGFGLAGAINRIV